MKAMLATRESPNRPEKNNKFIVTRHPCRRCRRSRILPATVWQFVWSLYGIF